MMQHVADGSTAVAVLAGLWAAFLWWRASEVESPLSQWPPRSPGEDEGTFMTGKLLTSMRTEAALSANLNSKAAKWTAASISIQAIATVLGRLAMP